VNLDAVREIADAVLYEGYLLYPYRASAVKNRSRWQFGVVMPDGYPDPSERSYQRAECVVECGEAFTVALRFLQVQARTVERWTGQRFEPTDALDVDDTTVTAWDEAVEREITVEVTSLPYEHTFRVDAAVHVEPVGAGRIVRRHGDLTGTITVTADPVPGPWRARRLRVHVTNLTPPPDNGDRAAALARAFVGCHTVLGVTGGAFLSMVDPPEWAAAEVAGCVNVGTWPVLAGPPSRRDLMLCAPIILYDHPRIAPESAGDLFDGTEIDELLTLRTLTLSEAEKREARATDPRIAALLARTEALTPDQLGGMHGAIREVGPDSVAVAGEQVRAGSRVRLRPGQRRTDAQDMFLTGRVAVVEAVLRDLDDTMYLAVTLADDPGADIQRNHGRFRYFRPDEVEPCHG